nr:uncharacterized protein LOC112010817 [Quercus suber]
MVTISTSRFHYLIPRDNLEQGLRLINGDDDVVYMCEIHAAWPTDKITLYVEGGEEPLVVEQPFGNEEVANDDDVHEVGQNDDDLHEMHEGGNVDAKGGGGQDFDWLEEGFEGPDFDDDVFGNVDDGPSTHGVSVNAATPHRPSKGDDGPSTHEDLHVYAAPHKTIAADNDPPFEKGEWIDPPFEDDMEILVGSDDDQAKRKATDLITGDEQLQYGKLRDYAEMIRLNDKGSKFLDDIGNPKQLNLVFITDRQKGLIPAIETLFPTCEHRYYVKHIYNNFKVDHKGLELKDTLATPTSSFMYEVDNGRERHVVDLAKKTCSCRIWDLTGLPCKHEIFAIVKNLEKVENYVHPCYLKETFAETYKEIIQPMPHQFEWVETNQPASIAPHVYKPPGRPPKQRKRDLEEPRNPYRVSRMNKTIKCGKCKKEGHNTQGSKSIKTKQTATPQTTSQPPSTRSQPAYRAFGQTASQPAPNNRSEAATQPPIKSRANWFSSFSQPSFHTPRET